VGFVSLLIRERERKIYIQTPIGTAKVVEEKIQFTHLVEFVSSSSSKIE